MSLSNKNNQSTSVKVNSVSEPIDKNMKTMSYAAATQKDQFPTRHHGLIMDCIDGLTLTDYTVSIGDIVQPINVLYSSRISNNRVCFYLKSKEMVETLTEKYDFALINGSKVTIRPLVSKQLRIIISNVTPPIPHYILEQKFDGLGIKLCAPISTLKATIAKEGYEHVLSQRRQTYINPEDMTKLPEFIKIEY